MFGLSSLYVKLIGGAIGLLILAGLFFGLKHYKSLAESRGETIAIICQSTRDASGQPKLKCGDVPKQIKFMGEAIGTLSAALDRQSAAVAAMGAETARQQKAAEDARKAAEKRASAAQGAVERLSASARAPERQTKPCEPSKALTETWR